MLISRQLTHACKMIFQIQLYCQVGRLAKTFFTMLHSPSNPLLILGLSYLKMQSMALLSHYSRCNYASFLEVALNKFPLIFHMSLSMPLTANMG